MAQKVGVTKAEIDLWISRLGLSLSKAQAAPLYDVDSTVVLIAGGIGAGKSFLSALFALTRMPCSPLVWIIGPDYRLTEPEFNEVVRFASALKLCQPKDISAPLHGSRRLTIPNMGVIETITSNDLLKIAGRGPTGVVLAEAAQQEQEVFFRAYERISRSEHPELKPWLVLSGTFEDGSAWYSDLWTELSAANTWNGRAYSVPTWENHFRFPAGYSDPDIVKIRDAMPRDRFEARYGARPVRSPGVVLPEFDPAVHIDPTITFNPEKPVELWVDPGFSDSWYAVEVVQLYQELPLVRIVDEIYVHYATHNDVIKLAKAAPWWPQVRGGVIDLAGRQHHGAKTPVEVWAAEGVPLRSRQVRVEDGIDRHRTFLVVDPASGQPRIKLSPRCRGAIAEYHRWRRKKDPSTGIFLTEPEKRNCDALKAIQYGLVDHYGLAAAARRPPPAYRPKRWR